MAKLRSQSTRGKGAQKGHFSGHETFPLRQIWLTKAFRYAASHNFNPACFNENAAIAELGVGKNMVSAIRHWALATDVLTEDSEGLHPGSLGKLLIGTAEEPGLDPWFENTNSVWLVHWALAGRGRRSTTWRWLFSRVHDATFDREKLASQLSQWSKDEGMASSENTLRRDLETCIRCYLPRASAIAGEEVAEPLLSELGLMSAAGSSNGLRFNKGPKRTLGRYTFLFTVLDFWDLKSTKSGAPPVAQVDLIDIALDFYAPGRVFKLSEEEIVTRLLEAESLTAGGLNFKEGVSKQLFIDHGKLTPRGAQTDREQNKYDLISRDYLTSELNL